MANLPSARRQNILTILESKDYAEVSYLSEYFSVSEMTIRRDIEKLEKEGYVFRVYGGVKLKDKKVMEGSVDERLSTHNQEKRVMAEEAVKLIQDGDVIAFDASTSALELSKLIKNRQNLTVVTNNINIAVELANAKNIAVILLGGFLRGKSLSLIGASLQKYLEDIYIDKAFLSSKALDGTEGLTDSTIDEGEAKQSIISKSKEVIVLADRSKLGKHAFFRVCSPDKLNYVITDCLEPYTMEQEECLTRLRESGVRIIEAKQEKLSNSLS